MKVGKEVIVDNFNERGNGFSRLHHDPVDAPFSIGHKGVITEILDDVIYGRIYEIDDGWFFYEKNLRNTLIVPNSLFSL